MQRVSFAARACFARCWCGSLSRSLRARPTASLRRPPATRSHGRVPFLQDCSLYPLVSCASRWSLHVASVRFAGRCSACKVTLTMVANAADPGSAKTNVAGDGHCWIDATRRGWRTARSARRTGSYRPGQLRCTGRKLASVRPLAVDLLMMCLL